jgi:chromosome segregation protein
MLGRRVQAEEELASVRGALESHERGQQDLEQARTLCQYQLEKMREALEAQRLARKEVDVQRQTLLEQLRALGAEVAAVQANLPPDLDEAAWQARLQQLAERIQRLGAVNLAAIEEFAQLSERRGYLDAQDTDLREALTTLENAIQRIDRETRSRFQSTFERVNENLQRLFPRLFGGGRAYLQLLGEDSLDGGVAIMARPPGKRIGTIHLLSGGEKALTAVALLFALFQLNPAPFCMLDEVDAPLDEANIARFGELLREMSEQIQFVFITHNKGTMEIARHLSGVTMHEPGVSRLVAVDVDEAIRLAATG